MAEEEPDQAADGATEQLRREIVAMREAGAAWNEIEKRFGMTRQQARYAYQLGKRFERRQARRTSGE